MSNYTSRTLNRGERIVRLAHLHWVIYTKSLMYFTLALAVILSAYATSNLGRVAFTIASALAVMGFRHALWAWWRQFTTEIAITDKRVIYKRGFIRRHTAEMFLDRIESVFVDQTVLGRMLNFGSIHCRGTGEGMEHLHHIADPLSILNAIKAN